MWELIADKVVVIDVFRIDNKDIRSKVSASFNCWTVKIKYKFYLYSPTVGMLGQYRLELQNGLLRSRSYVNIWTPIEKR